MKYALHGMCSLYSNLMGDIRLACDVGYQGLEIHTEKLWRYIHAGFQPADLKKAIDQAGLSVTAIDIIGSVEAPDQKMKNKIFKEAETLCHWAKIIGAPTIQLNGFSALNSFSTQENIRLMAKNIRQIADIGKDYGIRFQYEGAAWTPIHQLSDCLKLIEEVDRDNFGLVIDTWHFWASRGATPKEIAKLDKDIIYNIHLSDGKRPDINEEWVDEGELRGYLLGKGDIPIAEYISAIKETGYNGYYSGEFLNNQLWEGDYYNIAQTMLKQMKELMEN